MADVAEAPKKEFSSETRDLATKLVGLTLKQASRMLKYAIATGKTAVIAVTSLNPGGRQRGERSVESAIALLESSLANWNEMKGTDHAES